MFKIVCTKCGEENNLGLNLGTIDTDGNIYISNGDRMIDHIKCSCGNKIESE